MNRILQAAWKEFLYGGHLQCLGSIAILATAAGLFQAPFPWGLPVSTYAVSYAVYAYNRLLEVVADAETNPARSAFIAAHERAHWRAFFLSSVLAAVVVLTTASWYGGLFLGLLFVCGLLYTNIFKALTRFIPAFKTLYVAGAFAALVFLPFAYSERKIPLAAVAFAGWVFGDGAIMQIFLDVKDMDSDARSRLRTIPLLLGRKLTFRMLYGLTLVSAVPPLVWGSLTAHFPPETAALAIAPLLSMVAFRIAQKGWYQGYLMESGKFISWPALLALGRAMAG